MHTWFPTRPISWNVVGLVDELDDVKMDGPCPNRLSLHLLHFLYPMRYRDTWSVVSKPSSKLRTEQEQHT